MALFLYLRGKSTLFDGFSLKKRTFLSSAPCLPITLSITIGALKNNYNSAVKSVMPNQMPQKTSELPHQFSIRVYYEDTDAGGIVYYANYLKFFERARTELLRVVGINQETFLQQKLGFVVRHVEMNNLASAKLDDELEVQTSIVSFKRASLVFEQKIINHTQHILCTASVRIACVDFTQNKPCAIPELILGALKRVS